MTTKQYLQQAYYLNKKINGYAEKLDKLRDLSTSLPTKDASKDRVKENRRRDSIGDVVAAIVDLEAKIAEKLQELNEKANEIEALIDKIEDSKVRTVMFERYIMFRGWDEVAWEMGYSVQHVYRLHSKGLTEANILRCSEEKPRHIGGG